MKIELAKDIFGLTYFGVLDRIRRGVIKANKVYIGKGFYYDIPDEEINRYYAEKKRLYEAWEIVCDLKEDGMTFREIGLLVKPDAASHSQIGYLAVSKGVIVDIDGFYDRLEKAGL